jgi:hypothetical protein
VARTSREGGPCRASCANSRLGHPPERGVPLFRLPAPRSTSTRRTSVPQPESNQTAGAADRSHPLPPAGGPPPSAHQQSHWQICVAVCAVPGRHFRDARTGGPDGPAAGSPGGGAVRPWPSLRASRSLITSRESRRLGATSNRPAYASRPSSRIDSSCSCVSYLSWSKWPLCVLLAELPVEPRARNPPAQPLEHHACHRRRGRRQQYVSHEFLCHVRPVLSGRETTRGHRRCVAGQ